MPNQDLFAAAMAVPASALERFETAFEGPGGPPGSVRRAAKSAPDAFYADPLASA